MTQGLSKGDKQRSSVTDLMGGRSQGRSIRMRMNLAASGALMNKLTDMYDHPIQATVREVISNSIDATVTASISNSDTPPIEVEVPSEFSPEFIVRDYGVGMSEYDIENHFAVFGGSEKEDDFNQIGSYGLGAKAPLSYCDQFSFETTKDGVTSKVVVFRSEYGPETRIVSTENTGKDSGTVVKIPVNNKDSSTFVSDIKEFSESIESYKHFSFDAPIIINNVEYNGGSEYAEIGSIVIEKSSGSIGRVWVHRDSIVKSLDDLRRTNSSYDQMMTYSYVLSGYRYNPPGRERKIYQTNPSVIVELKPGVVDFVSSRDSITKNSRSALLNDIVEGFIYGESHEFLSNIVKSISEGEFSKKNVYDMMKKLNPSIDGEEIRFWNSTFNIDDFTTDEGVNVFLENKEFSDKNIYAFLKIYGGKKTSQEIGYFSKDETDFIGSFKFNDLKVNELNKDIINKLENSNNDTNSNISLLDCVELVKNALYSGRENKFYVALGMDSDKKIRNLVRCRKELSFYNEAVVLMTKESKIPQKEIDAFLSRKTDSYSKPEIIFIDDKFISEKLAAVRENAKAEKEIRAIDSVKSKVSLVTEGFESLSEMFKAAAGSSNMYSRSKDTVVSSLYGNNALIVVTSKGWNRVTLFDILNGYQHDKGFDSLKNREVYIIDSPLKNAVMSLVESGEEIIRYGKFDHISKPAQEAINEFPTFNFPIETDKLNSSSDDEIIAKLIDMTYKSYSNDSTIDRIKENIDLILQVSESFGFEMRSVDMFKNFIKVLDIEEDYKKLPSFGEEYTTERFGESNSIMKKVKKLKKFDVGFNGWINDSSFFKASMKAIVEHGNEETGDKLPEYMLEPMLRFIESELTIKD